MFDLKNNDISTFLLLICLGLLIWYLTKQKKTNEGFINSDLIQLPQIPTQMQVPQVPVPQMPQIQMPTQMQVPQMPTQMQVPTTQIQEINSFLAFDNDDNYGADINDAFKSQNCSSNNLAGYADKKLATSVDLNNKVQDYDSNNFLPKEIHTEWFSTDFSQAASTINDDNLINTERYVIGINTVGQSLKNASHDIRGTIANPKFSVSPWNNSTYEPDYNIKSLS